MNTTTTDFESVFGAADDIAADAIAAIAVTRLSLARLAVSDPSLAWVAEAANHIADIADRVDPTDDHSIFLGVVQTLNVLETVRGGVGRRVPAGPSANVLRVTLLNRRRAHRISRRLLGFAHGFRW